MFPCSTYRPGSWLLAGSSLDYTAMPPPRFMYRYPAAELCWDKTHEENAALQGMESEYLYTCF